MCIGDIFRPSFDMPSFDILCSQAWHPKLAFIINMTVNAGDSEFRDSKFEGRLVKKLCCLSKLQIGRLFLSRYSTNKAGNNEVKVRSFHFALLSNFRSLLASLKPQYNGHT